MILWYTIQDLVQIFCIHDSSVILYEKFIYNYHVYNCSREMYAAAGIVCLSFSLILYLYFFHCNFSIYNLLLRRKLLPRIQLILSISCHPWNYYLWTLNRRGNISNSSLCCFTNSSLYWPQFYSFLYSSYRPWINKTRIFFLLDF